MPKPRKRPLHDEVVRRWPGLEESADQLIAAGKVVVDGLPRTNARSVVPETASIRIEQAPTRLRGYEKLSRAIERVQPEIEGAHALDAGASAGGFTQVLLNRGARRVYAVEVGYGQLLGSLRQDRRVVNLERTNVGALDRDAVPDALDAVTLDLGYLALATAVPQLNVLAFSPRAWLLALVKPVAELGLGELRTDDATVDEAIALAERGISSAGWNVRATFRSPLPGAGGAIEAWVHATRRSRRGRGSVRARAARGS